MKVPYSRVSFRVTSSGLMTKHHTTCNQCTAYAGAGPKPGLLGSSCSVKSWGGHCLSAHLQCTVPKIMLVMDLAQSGWMQSTSWGPHVNLELLIFWC